MGDPRKGIDEIFDVLTGLRYANLPGREQFYNAFIGNKDLRSEIYGKLKAEGFTNLPDTYEKFEMAFYEPPKDQRQYILDQYKKRLEQSPVSLQNVEKEASTVWNKFSNTFEEPEKLPPSERLKVRTHEVSKFFTAISDQIIQTPAGLVNLGLNYNLPATVSRIFNGGKPADLFLDAQQSVLKWSKDAQEFTKEKIETAFPTDPKLESSFAHTTVPQAFGSFAGFAAFGLVGRAAGLTGKAADFLFPILSGIGAETESILEDASQYDKNVFQRKDLDLLYAGGLVSGTLEGLQMGMFFNRIGKLGGMSLLKKTVSFLRNPAEEGIQEYLQTVTENATAKLTYDVTRELTQGAMESAGAGAIVGFFFGSVGHIIQEKKKDPNLSPKEKTLLDKAEELYIKQGSKIIEAAVNEKLSMNKFAEGISKTGDVYSALRGITKTDEEASNLLGKIEQHPDFLETQGAIERLIGKGVEKLTKAEMKHLTHLTAIGKLGTVRQLLAEKGITPEGSEANLPNSFDMYRDVISNYALQRVIPRKETTDEAPKVPGENIKKAPTSKALREEEKTPELLKEINDISIEDLYFHAEAYHGTPHKFESVDASKRGTGEGFAAFGVGALYTSTKERIARWYAEKLSMSKTPPEVLSDIAYTKSDITTTRGLIEEAKQIEKYLEKRNKKIEEIEDNEIVIEEYSSDENQFMPTFITASEAKNIYNKKKAFEQKLNFLENRLESLASQVKNKYLYKLLLWEGKEQNLLNWDKLITDKQLTQIIEQGRKEKITQGTFNNRIGGILKENEEQVVKDFLERFESSDPTGYEEEYGNLSKDEKMAKATKELKDNWGIDIAGTYIEGKNVYEELIRTLGSPEEASKFLERAGFHGIEYIGTESGETNYVVFNEADIKIIERIQFQKPIPGKEVTPEGKVPANRKEMPLEMKFEAKQLSDNLEKLGIADQTLKPLMDWLNETVGKIDVQIMDSNSPVGPNGELLNGNKGAYQQYKVGNELKSRIILNKDAFPPTRVGVYQTLVHELFHAATVDELKRNREFRDSITAIRNELRTRFNTDLKSAYKANQAEIDLAMESDEEFISHIMSATTSNFKRLLKDTSVSNYSKQSILDKIIRIISNFMHKHMGMKPKSFHDALEIELQRFVNLRTDFEQTPSSDVVNYSNSQEIQDKIEDKLLTMREEALTDPSTIEAIGKIVAASEGEDISDYYKYLKLKSFDQLLKVVGENPQWKSAAIFHYQKNFTGVFPSFELYKMAILRQFYGHIQNLEKQKVVRLTLTYRKDKWDDKVEPEVNIVEFNDTYRDADRMPHSVYKPSTKLNEILPIMSSILGSEIELVYIDRVEKRNIIKGRRAKKSKQSHIASQDFDHIREDGTETRNEDYTRYMNKLGYYFPGTWADKKTVIAFKVKGEQEAISKTLKSFRDLYSQKSKEFVKFMVTRDYGQDVWNNIQESEDPRMRDWLAYAQSTAQTGAEVMRLIAEDIRLGGRMTKEGWKTALYNPADPNTFDAIKMFKRPYLVAEKSFVHLDKKEIDYKLNHAGFNHGMEWADNELMTSAMIFNAEPKSGLTTVEYKDKTFDVSQILIDTFGDATTDGKIIYVLGGFDEIYRSQHGTVRKGSIKAFIANRFGSDTFNAPFYVKGAFHGISRNEPLAQWMIKNNITFLISSTAAKVNSYPVDALYSAKPNIVKIPFKEIHRDHEKSSAKLSARGFAQTLTANYAIEFNPAFVDEGWTESINQIVNNLHKKFKEDMHNLTPSGVLEYLKDKAFHGASDYERVASKVILSMVFTKLDQQYANVTDISNRLMENKLLSAKAKDKAAQILDKWKTRYVNFSDQQAKKISNIFHDPYFTELLRGKIKDSMEYITRFKIPATWAVLDSDMGFLTARRYELIEKHVKDMFINNKKKSFVDKGAKIIDKIHQLTEEKANMFGAIQGAVGEDKIKLTELDAAIQKDIDDYTKQYEEYYKDEKINFESNQFKESVRMNDENRAEINKMLNEIVDLNTGRLKPGHILITSDIANRMKAKTGDKLLFDKKQNKVIVAAVPSDSILSTSGPTVVGVMTPELSEPGKIIMNSEYAQGILGKDFDIDTMYITFADRNMMSEDMLEKMTASLNKTIEKHKKKMLSEYRKVLRNEEFTVRRNIEKIDGGKEWMEVTIPGNKLEFQDILKKEVRLAYTQKANGVRQSGRTLFNPAGEGRFLLNEYRKDVGKIVNRRKKFTTKSQIGLTTTINTPYGKIKINPRHKKAWQTYMLLLNMTNDMVDVPTNTNKFFYNYDNIQAFDQDNGTNLYDIKEAGNPTVRVEIDNLVDTIDEVEKFLFGYGIRLTTDYNLDKFGDERTMEDELKYIKQQQQINRLIDTKNFGELQRQFKQWYELNNQFRDELEVAKEVEIGEQYIANMKVEGTDLNPMLHSINLFDENDIPSVSMSEEEYVATQADMVTSMLSHPKWTSIKEAFDRVLKNNHLKDIIDKIPKSNYAINKPGFENYTSNNLLAQLFFMTVKNPELHLLKAGMITIINPENQTTYKKELLESLRTNPASGIYLDSIYQLANEISYPHLVRMLFKNRSIAFKKDIMQFDKGVRFRNMSGHLQVEVDFNGQTYKVDSTELPNRQEEFWKRTARYIYEDMFKDPENRVKLTDMLELGGENTQITERIAVVSEILSKELPKYSRFDRLLFWTSLLGKPENNMRKTTNFILPRTRKTGFFNQERLYQVLAQTNEEVANHFMYAYAPSFADNYRGLNFYENMKITQLEIDSQIFGEDKGIEIWYQGDMHDAMVQDQETNFKADFESIYDIARQEERNIPETNNPVGIVLNMESQTPEFIYNIDVMNTFSKYVTKVSGPINKSMIALTKALSVSRSVNIIKNREFLRDTKIERLLNDMLKDKRQSKEQILIDIHNIEETNPYNIIIEKNIGGSYSYHTPGRAEAYPDTKQGLEKMFTDLGVPKRDMKKHQMALEYHKRYSIDHIEDLDTMIDYFETLMRSLPKDFGRADVLEGILFKYRTLRKQFDKQLFKYFPRVYDKQVAYNVYKKENIAQIEVEVREKNPNLPEKEINDLIEREVADRFSNLSFDNYTNWIHSWMLRRKLKDGNNAYVKNSLIPHQIHQKQFLSMIQNDVLLSDWILYEHDAASDGTSQDIINKVHRWYGFISSHKLLRTKTIGINEAKQGDNVHFYYRQKKKDGTYRDNFIRGTVDVISDDIVKVKVNPERMEKKIQAELADKRREHDEIVRQGNRPATPTQFERLAQFYEEGFIDGYKSNISKLDANDLIIQGYEEMLGKRENWGRFERKNVFIKQYEGADIKMVSGFYKEQDKTGKLDEAADFLNQLSSVAFLGGPSGGVRNFIDASWALQRDLRGWRYWKNSFGASVFALNVYLSKKSGELDKFRPAMISAIDEWNKQAPDLSNKELEEAAEGFATDYIIKEVLYKANLGDLSELKGETFASKLQKLVSTGKAVGEAITLPFRAAEKLVRSQAAYMYARKAVVDDGITDPKLIRLAIEKGVARTQSLYDNMHRKLGEDSSFGALLFKFSQYNSFQLQMTMLEIQQAKRLGIKFNLQNMFSRTIESIDENGVKHTHKAGDTIDPNIANRMLVDFWIDTFGIVLGNLTPGFRASSPVNKAVAMPLSFLAQMLVFGEDPDDWDLRDWAYGISAFFLGLGFTLPIQVLANLSGKWGMPIPFLTNDKQGIIPVNPRISQFAVQLYEMTLGQEEVRPDKRTDQAIENQRQLEKFFFSFNIITPTARRYYSENQKDFGNRTIIEKPLYFLEKNRWLFTPVPILNIAGNQ